MTGTTVSATWDLFAILWPLLVAGITWVAAKASQLLSVNSPRASAPRRRDGRQGCEVVGNIT